MSSTIGTIRLVQTIARLIRANLPLEPALKELAGNGFGAYRKLAAAVATNLEQGQTLSEALAHGNRQAQTLGATIQLGQQAGQLDSSLESWAQLQLSQSRHRLQMATAMVYPCTLVVLATCSLVYCLYTLLPQYDSAFRELTTISPQWLEWLTWTRSNLWPVAIAIAASLLAPLLILIYRRNSTNRFGLARDKAIQLYGQAHVARLARLGLTTGQARDDLLQLLLSACSTDSMRTDSTRADSKLRAAQLLGRETTEVLATLETGAIPFKDADSLLATLAVQLQSSAEFLSQRDERWLPMIVSLAVGALVALIYALLIYLPWVVLFCYLATPVLV